ncbi:MAG: hypothetical protein ACYTEK_17390 [Planctomycetota bacterium]|jgi:anti-sigma28 factor (negative regulator of flagellin synthesis)
MSVLSRQKGKSAVVLENTEISLSEGAGNKARGRIAAPVLQNIPSRPRVRKDRVLAVQQQLAKGRYDLDEGLDAVVDSLLADLTK